jgi:hypothetical protein
MWRGFEARVRPPAPGFGALVIWPRRDVTQYPDSALSAVVDGVERQPQQTAILSTIRLELDLQLVF